ncbi:transmembrane protein, putative [Medicago truncatula]|uniref:Transmembrane protein, putative n=1 Tax=Medicago truncatula TaxID=3880 RepID=A0A072UWT9_MEDTR|nr:transmembrane protein, putative [Medicago truncatula]
MPTMNKREYDKLNPDIYKKDSWTFESSSFRNSRSELWQFKRKATLELRDGFYLLLDFLGIILVTICLGSSNLKNRPHHPTKILANESQHSPTCSSSQTSNLRHHLLASPPTTKPKELISATKANKQEP